MIARAFLGSSNRARRFRRRATTKEGPDPQEWLLDHRPCSYWVATRRPFPSLLFVAPLAMVYESAVLGLGGAVPAGALRTGADAWMRRGLTALGLADPWFLPLLLVRILMGWQFLRSH